MTFKPKRMISLLLTAAVAFGLQPVYAVTAASLNPGRENAADYGRYRSSFVSSARTDKDVDITLPATAVSHMDNAEMVDDAQAQDRVACVQPGGSMTWSLNMEAAGCYCMEITYRPAAQGNNDIKVAAALDGTVPFSEASVLVLPRLWKDKNSIAADLRGNDIRPGQENVLDWTTMDFRDSEGLYSEPFVFSIPAGDHTLTLQSVSEAVSIASIRLHVPTALPAYREYLEANADVGKYAGRPIRVEAEDVYTKTSSSLVAVNDMLSPLTTPYSASKIRLNAFGGYNWKYAGQTATWKVQVPDTALYKVSVRYFQNYSRGLNSHRRLYVNGQVPFEEANNLGFRYGIDWQSQCLGEEDDAFYIRLNAGENDLSLEVTLGDSAEILQILEQSILDLNTLYRKIIMVTGTAPDSYRDYSLEAEIPDLVSLLTQNADVLDDLVARIKAATVNTNSEVSSIEQTVRQLRDMADRVKTITKGGRLDHLKSNISNLGALATKLREQPLEIDSFTLLPEGSNPPAGKAGWAANLKHKFDRFFASFSEDYSKLSGTSGSTSIKVWMQTGRDQAQILKNMLDDTFTPSTGISVELELVQGGLIEATLAGRGPDVALNRGDSDPVNLAMRGALYDLSAFPEYPQVSDWFFKGTTLPYLYKGGYYALPERQVFDVLFYRQDILDELGLTVPRTWDELILDVLPVLQRSNMAVGIGNISTVSEIATSNIFTTLLYQSGGKLYSDDLTRSQLDSQVAYEAFKTAVELYRDYKLPQEYDFMNRFRTGEMPLAIAPYTSCNILSLGAPEIAGLWGMAALPGTLVANGAISRTEVMGGTAAVMFRNVREPRACWEFLKWWVGEETQSRYGLEQEAVLGSSGRYDSANLAAFNKLPWESWQEEIINAQRSECTTVEQLPGSYYTSRAISNAFISSVLNYEIPREQLLYWSEQINLELKRKSEEFGAAAGEE